MTSKTIRLRRKADGFEADMPVAQWNAYGPAQKAEWDEVKPVDRKAARASKVKSEAKAQKETPSDNPA